MSTTHHTQNPLLHLSAVRRLQALPAWVRLSLLALLSEIRAWAETKAQHSWRRRKGPMASYYLAVGVYAGHIARALRAGLPRGLSAAGMHGYLDCSTAHLSPATLALCSVSNALGAMTVAAYDYGAFVSVPDPDYLPPDLPADLAVVLQYAGRLGAVVVRFDADGETLDLPTYEHDGATLAVSA